MQKFLKSNELVYELNSSGDEARIHLTKTAELIDDDADAYCDVNSAAKPKAIFLKDCKIGDDPLGSKLIQSFLGSINSMPAQARPAVIAFVNKAVFLTTDRANPCYGLLRDLSFGGVRVMSCGTCLEAFELTDKLGVGEVANAFEIMQILLSHDCVSL